MHVFGVWSGLRRWNSTSHLDTHRQKATPVLNYSLIPFIVTSLPIPSSTSPRTYALTLSSTSPPHSSLSTKPAHRPFLPTLGHFTRPDVARYPYHTCGRPTRSSVNPLAPFESTLAAWNPPWKRGTLREMSAAVEIYERLGFVSFYLTHCKHRSVVTGTDAR